MKKEHKTFDCEYMQIAEDPRYMYMHLSVDKSCLGFGTDMMQYQPFIWIIELFCLITDKIPYEKFNCGVDWEDLEKHMRENHPEL